MVTTVSSVRPTPAAARPEQQQKPQAAARQAPEAQEQRPAQQAAAPRQGQETQQIQKQSAAEQAKSVQAEGFVHRVEEAAKAVRAEIQGRIGVNVDTQA